MTPPLPIIAWDGEGITTRKDHRYVLLTAGTAEGIITERAASLDGLTLAQSLNTLATGLARFPAMHVTYAFTYDVTMILRRLSRLQLTRLHDGRPLALGLGDSWYRIEWRPRRYLKVMRRSPSLDWHGGTLWDLWSYTQASFLDACLQFGVGTHAELQLIRDGKERRASFTARHLAFIETYNRLELALMAQLAGKIRAATEKARLSLKRWDGPGPAAAALLAREGMGKRRAAVPPAGVEHASRHAYYGGRSEVVAYGHSRKTPVAEYDITSAYPSVLADAPCTARGCGHWVYYDAADKIPPTSNVYALHRIRWSGDASARRIHPFPWRAPNGSVYFPPSGEGWVWTSELLAGSTTHDVEILESWQWEGKCIHPTPPYAWVRRIFGEREELARAGDGSERALKMALNTIYGKFAQRAGAVRIKDKHGKLRGWKRPRWYDLCLAGFLTAGIRARLYLAAAPIQDRVLLLATDSLIVRAVTQLDASVAGGVLYLPDLQIGDGLGAWTLKRYTGATVVQSGMYWLHSGNESDAHTRGVDAGTLEWVDIVRAWRAYETHVSARATRFGSIASTRSAGRGWRTLGQWRSETKQVAVHPWGTKRAPEISDRTRRPLVRPDRGFCPTRAVGVERFARGGSLMTTAIGVPWARDPDPELAQ